MIGLEDGMLLYHGSYISITQYRMAAFCGGQSKKRPLSTTSEKIQRN